MEWQRATNNRSRIAARNHSRGSQPARDRKRTRHGSPLLDGAFEPVPCELPAASGRRGGAPRRRLERVGHHGSGGGSRNAFASSSGRHQLVASSGVESRLIQVLGPIGFRSRISATEAGACCRFVKPPRTPLKIKAVGGRPVDKEQVRLAVVVHIPDAYAAANETRMVQ